jgi:hypothetical protein
MIIYVLMREDQNDHGYVDTSIAGIFRNLRTAQEHEEAARARALQQGLRVCDEDDSDPDWQVSWKVEDHVVR